MVHMENGKVAYRALVERLGGKRPLGRPTRRWEHKIMDLQEIGRRGV